LNLTFYRKIWCCR